MRNPFTKTGSSRFSAATALLFSLLLSAFPAFADLIGPYTPDTNTLFLLHFDEAAGGSVTTNLGMKGGNFYSVSEATSSATPPLVTTMLGGAGYVNGPTNFNNCMTNPTVGYLFGYDANKSGAYDGEGSAPAPDALAMTNLNIGFGGQSPFTIEALIQPTTLGANQEIICTDSSSGSRAFQFRITAPGTLTFTYITSGGSISAPIPSTGPDAFVPGTWYHVAIVYNGTVGQLYWTKLDPANGAAHSLGSPTAIVLGTTQGAFTGPLCIGNENRAASGEQFQGSIDEVRISSVARGSGQMQFFSRFVTISANPVSQNVDYNQPVNFSVSASSSFALGYQWRVNSNNIPNATNTAYSIANVAASDAGYYDCVVTNTGGFSATSTEAHLVVGAANFLADRYSFTTDTTDSIGGQTGTNFGDATVNGGKLVLDGTTGTYMQLPGNLFNGANATALTVEFWASFGVNPNNVYAFAFGTTNFVLSAGIVGFNYAQFSPHNAAGQTAATTPGDPGVFTETLNAPGNLDGRTVHVAVVFDPPNKLLSIYTNGVLEAVATNNTVNISSLNDQFSLIGASLYAVDPYLNASIDEIRIFKGALSPLTIKQSQDQGPDTLLADGPAQFVLQPTNTSVPVGQTVTFTTAAVGYLPITYQWLKNGTLVPNETNATYSFATVLGDNTATIKVYATNTIGVTTYVTNSTTATLSVFVPPTVAWLDNADGGANNLWDTTSLNWTNTTGGGPLAFVQNDSTIFDNRGAGSPNVDIQQSVSPNSIQVNATSDYSMGSSSGVGALSGQGSLTKLNSGRLTIDVSNNLSGPVTISGGTVQVGNNDSVGSLGSGVVTNNGTVSIARADAALNFGNAIHGSGSLSFDGLGSVTLSGNSDYTGASAVNAGIVFLTSSNGLGSANSGTAIANAAQVYITANVNVAEGFTINGAGDNNGALRKGGAGLTTESGPITLAADSTIGVDTGATLTVSNTIGGGFALTAIGGGTLALINNSTLSGFTLNGAIVNVGAQGALGSGPVVVSGAGRFVLADGMTFTNAITANSVSPGAVTGLIMVNDNSNGIVTTVTGPLTFNATAASGNDFYGPLTSGLLNITGPITNETTSIVGARDGFVRFSGGGDYLEFDQNQGTTSIGANNGLSTNAILSQGASGPSVFDLNGFNQTLVGLADGAANPKVLTNSSSTASTLTLNLNSGVAYGGSLGGNVSLVVTGVGSQQLTGTNRYTGNTTIKAGLLQVSNPSFSAGSTVTIANGALLQMDFTTTNIINKLVLNGVSQPPGLYNNSSSSSFILGTGTLLVSLVNPTPTNIVTTVNGNQLTLSWPSDHIGWRLQAQTNPPGVGLNSTWVDVGGSTNVNTVPITIIGTNGSVFFRMIYP